MRRFGRQCRGQGKVFVSLVRQTETQLLTTGEPVVALARTAQAQVQTATAVDGGPADALGHHADRRPDHPSADRHPIAAPHARQAPDAL